MIEYLFSTKGRIGRGGWWIRMILVLPLLFSVFFAIVMGLMGVANENNNEQLTIIAMLLMIIGVLLFVRAYIATSVRRHHDQGKSGWNILWILVPGIGALIDMIMSGFMPGQDGANQYGPSTKQPQFVNEAVKSSANSKPKMSKPRGNWTKPTTPVKTPARIQIPAKVKRQVHARYDRTNAVQTPLVSRHVGLWGRLLGKK